MDFGKALAALKRGRLVRRSGWNGTHMYIYLDDGHDLQIRSGPHKGVTRYYEPMICMFTAHKRHQPGWLASQEDMLALDWELATRHSG